MFNQKSALPKVPLVHRWNRFYLTHFRLMFPFYTPWKIKGFLVFWGGIKWNMWQKQFRFHNLMVSRIIRLCLRFYDCNIWDLIFLLKADHTPSILLKAAFQKFYLVHSWILCRISYLVNVQNFVLHLTFPSFCRNAETDIPTSEWFCGNQRCLKDFEK